MRIGLVFVGCVVVGCFLDLRALKFLEDEAYDLRTAVYGELHGSLKEQVRQQITLVEITDETWSQLGIPEPPLPWSYHAKVIRELTRAGAKAIAFDITFDREDPEAAELAAAAAQSKRVVWGSRFEDENTPAQVACYPNELLRRASPVYGHVLLRQDPVRGTVDRLQAVIMDRGQPVPALSMMAVMVAKGFRYQAPQRVLGGWRIGDLRVETDRRGELRIGFVGTPGEENFPVVPYDLVYQGIVDDPFYVENGIFRDRIILIGSGTSLLPDTFQTPFGELWGLEAHAHAVATLLQQNYVREAPPWVNVALICLLTALVCPCAGLCRLWRGLLFCVIVLLGYFVLNVWLFVDHRLFVHLAGPSVAAALATAGLLTERSLLEEREKNRARGLLCRYVSTPIAAHILEHPDGYLLGGVETTATVLFSDIRGFTALSERLSPQEVVTHLNEYLDVMTEIVFRHDGAVDKYVGDCIMALYGVPVPHPDHARRAVATAIEMQAAVQEHRERRQERDLPGIEIGIGINTGPLVVGNIGATHRHDFTVIGDTVNVAARVESLNRDFGTRILITEGTYESVKGEVEVRGPFTASVRGREAGVALYEVLGWQREPS